ncbi:FAD-linked oxidoreductase [Pluteus cervinus]|uniref:FAD-linked oxidoreductase n=1 Tax=Pluteus cervinus TaxID=181527 RepID=A0ACD3AQ34_9AGAR|nr:FAD-linked oxidoreductase [Pluteus cervinus]
MTTPLLFPSSRHLCHVPRDLRWISTTKTQMTRPLLLRGHQPRNFHSSRSFRDQAQPSAPFERLRRRKNFTLLIAGLGGAVLGLSLYSPPVRYNDAGQAYSPSWAGRVQASAEEGDTGPTRGSRPTMDSLIRAYIVYTMCSSTTLVDSSPTILKTLMGIPGLNYVVEWVVRKTFFDQFVGGDNAQDCIPLLEELRRQNKGALFAYSVEVDEDEATAPASSANSSPNSIAPVSEALPPHKRIVEEMIRCTDVAADFEDGYSRRSSVALGRKTWVAVKLTALLPDCNALINLSKHILASRRDTRPMAFPGSPESTDLDVLTRSLEPSPFLNMKEIRELTDLRDDLRKICRRARARGVKIIIDAEYSWYQPALDAYTLTLMQEFNRIDDNVIGTAVQPLVYGTYQAYLRRTPEHLERAIAHSKLHGYSLGVKLVRGAYHPHEMAAHSCRPGSDSRSPNTLSISPDALPPVWDTKDETDRCYNSCLRMLVGAVKVDIDSSPSPSPSLSPPAVSSLPGLRASPWYSSWFARDMQTSPAALIPPVVTPVHTTNGTGSPRIGVLFGTHNWKSCGLILDELVRSGLAKERSGPSTSSPGEAVVEVTEGVADRIAIGQLYGMSDELTDWLVNRTRSSSPLIIKYVPYGALSEVMPYLSRRAIENKSVLGDGGATRERQRAGKEIWGRVKETVGL